MIATLSALKSGHFMVKNAFLAIFSHLVTSMSDPMTPVVHFWQWPILASVPAQVPFKILKVFSFFFIFFPLWIWGVMNFQIWALLAHLLAPYGYPRTMFAYSCSRHISWSQLSQKVHSQLIFSLIFKKNMWHISLTIFAHLGALGPPLSQYGYRWAYPTSPYAVFLLIVHAQVAPGPFLWWSDDFSICGTC